MENTHLISDLTLYTKLTLLEENICDLGLGKDFSDKTQKLSKEKNNNQTHPNLDLLCLERLS